MMERGIDDVDIRSSGRPEEIECILDKRIGVGKEDGTMNVFFENENYEISTFRCEDE